MYGKERNRDVFTGSKQCPMGIVHPAFSLDEGNKIEAVTKHLRTDSAPAPYECGTVLCAIVTVTGGVDTKPPNKTGITQDNTRHRRTPAILHRKRIRSTNYVFISAANNEQKAITAKYVVLSSRSRGSTELWARAQPRAGFDK